MKRVLVWLAAGIVVVLLGRSLAYALEPGAAARLLEQRAGGPELPVLTLVALTLGMSIAVLLCWLTVLGVGERALLERRTPAPRFRVARTLVFALLLGGVTSVSGALLEAYLHWRAGLGWHGLECLTGPAHRDLFPLDFGLSFVAAAVVAAFEHVLAWMRRTFSLLRELPPRLQAAPLALRPLRLDVPAQLIRFAAGSPRAPPPLS
jgi:hypothetical protein